MAVPSDGSAFGLNGIKGELVLSERDIKGKRHLDARRLWYERDGNFDGSSYKRLKFKMRDLWQFLGDWLLNRRLMEDFE